MRHAPNPICECHDCHVVRRSAGAEASDVPCSYCGGIHGDLEACRTRGVQGTDVADPQRQREIAIEDKAREIYDGWKNLPGWVPWVEGGNSFRQDDARIKAADGVALPDGGQTV